MTDIGQSRVVLERLDASAAAGIVDELVTVYLDVYADSGDPFFGEDRYRQQLSGHMSAPAWSVVTGRSGDELVGYAYGFPLGPATRWWHGWIGDPPEGFTTETGHRTWAVSEIMVRASWRRQGIARRLHDELLRDRPEERATLLVEPENTPAQAAYASWGWQHIGQLRPDWPDAPLYDVLVLPLRRQDTF